MGDEILIKAKSFIETFDSIVLAYDNINEVRENIVNANNSLESEWLGKSGDKFIETTEALDIKLGEYAEGLSILANDINTVLESFIELDERLSSEVEGGEK